MRMETSLVSLDFLTSSIELTKSSKKEKMDRTARLGAQKAMGLRTLHRAHTHTRNKNEVSETVRITVRLIKFMYACREENHFACSGGMHNYTITPREYGCDESIQFIGMAVVAQLLSRSK